MKNLIISLMIFIPAVSFSVDTMQDNINEISKHYSASPSLYHLNGINKEKLSDKITRQYIMGAKSMLVKWTFKKDAVVPLHFHPNEQITWITKGSVKVISQGKQYIVKSGDVIIIPSNVPHEFIALEDTIDIDYFTPVREDWLNNTASYIQTIEKK